MSINCYSFSYLALQGKYLYSFHLPVVQVSSKVRDTRSQYNTYTGTTLVLHKNINPKGGDRRWVFAKRYSLLMG